MRLVALTVALFSSTSAFACAMPMRDDGPSLVALMEAVDQAKTVVVADTTAKPEVAPTPTQTGIPEMAAVQPNAAPVVTVSKDDKPVAKPSKRAPRS